MSVAGGAVEDKEFWHPLDEADRGIIECLREDGRMSSARIAERLDISERTVRRRLRSLEQHRGLRVVPVVDPDAIGLTFCMFLRLSVERDRLAEVTDAVAAMPEVRYLAHTTGPWDLLAEAFVGSREHMAEFILETIGQISGVRRVDTFDVLRVTKFAYEWEVPQIVASRTPPVSIAHPTPPRDG